MTELVTTCMSEGVAQITLNRPERMNAFDVAMGHAFDEAMVESALDPAVRVIVLTGAGERAFTVGAEVDRLERLASRVSDGPAPTRPGRDNALLDSLADAPAHLRTRYTLPMAVPQPVIAAINGACAGVGLALAVHCDIRFASRTARFSAAFSQRGLPAEVALAKTLQDLLGRGVASDVLISGRKFGAEEALRMGLVNAVLEPEELAGHALEYARAIARDVSPRAARIIKRQLRLAADQTLEEALNLAREEMHACWTSEDFKEGVESYIARRPPEFSGR